MNLNLRCPEIFQMIKMASKNYQDSCTPGTANKLLNYDCRKTKFDSGSSLLWGISRENM